MRIYLFSEYRFVEEAKRSVVVVESGGAVTARGSWASHANMVDNISDWFPELKL